MSRGSNNEMWKVCDVFEKNQDTKLAECNFCKKSLSYKTTVTNLKQHLKLKHISVYQEFLTRSSISRVPGSTLNVYVGGGATLVGEGVEGEPGPNNTIRSNPGTSSVRDDRDNAAIPPAKKVCQQQISSLERSVQKLIYLY